MATYKVYKHPLTGQLDAVKKGYAFWAMTMQIFGIGFIWAFVKKATNFGWQVLTITILLFIWVLISGNIFAAVGWVIIAIAVGQMANRRVEHGLKRRGFVVIAERMKASSPDRAIDNATSGSLQPS
jgi:hypothetical protein